MVVTVEEHTVQCICNTCYVLLYVHEIFVQITVAKSNIFLHYLQFCYFLFSPNLNNFSVFNWQKSDTCSLPTGLRQPVPAQLEPRGAARLDQWLSLPRGHRQPRVPVPAVPRVRPGPGGAMADRFRERRGPAGNGEVPAEGLHHRVPHAWHYLQVRCLFYCFLDKGQVFCWSEGWPLGSVYSRIIWESRASGRRQHSAQSILQGPAPPVAIFRSEIPRRQ